MGASPAKSFGPPLGPAFEVAVLPGNKGAGIAIPPADAECPDRECPGNPAEVTTITAIPLLRLADLYHTPVHSTDDLIRSRPIDFDKADRASRSAFAAEEGGSHSGFNCHAFSPLPHGWVETHALTVAPEAMLSVATMMKEAVCIAVVGRQLFQACEHHDTLKARAILSLTPSLANWQNANCDGETCLHLVAKLGFADLADELLLAGAEPSCRNTYGWTPMHVAAMTGHLKLIQILVRAGVGLEELDRDHRTSMHWAALYNHDHVLRSLIRAGANPISLTVSGATPRDYATSRETRALLRLLEIS